jgi:hypothetical protein
VAHKADPLPIDPSMGRKIELAVAALPKHKRCVNPAFGPARD